MTIRRIVALSGSIALLLAGCAADADTAASDDQTSASAAEASAANSDEDEHDEVDDTGESDEAADDDHEDGDGAGDDAAAAADEDVDRVVQVDMEDIAFSVEELEFAVGERVRFDFVNVGQAPHEALIGDLHVQEEHEQEMEEGADHDEASDDEEASDDDHEDELTTISLESGESGSFVHEFTEAGELWMGCHVPGHWDAGMRTRITVTG